MSLSPSDRKWVEEKFNRLDDRLDRLALAYTADKERHIKDFHNIYKTVGLMSAIAVGLAALIEVGKHLTGH